MDADDTAPSTASVDPLRGPKRLLAWGSGVAVLFAVGSSLAGGEGALGLFLLLLVLALVFGLTGLWIAGRALRLQFDEQPAAPTSHWVIAIVMFVAAMASMVASGGVAATLGTPT